MPLSCNRQNMKLWIDALRSGNYEQCRNRLTIVDDTGRESHCCLGVACEVAIANGSGTIKTTHTESAEYDGMGGILPDSVQNWLGLNNRNPTIDGHTCSRWNDTFCASFNQIADALERTYLGDENVKVETQTSNAG